MEKVFTFFEKKKVQCADGVLLLLLGGAFYVKMP